MTGSKKGFSSGRMRKLFGFTEPAKHVLLKFQFLCVSVDNIFVNI